MLKLAAYVLNCISDFRHEDRRTIQKNSPNIKVCKPLIHQKFARSKVNAVIHIQVLIFLARDATQNRPKMSLRCSRLRILQDFYLYENRLSSNCI